MRNYMKSVFAWGFLMGALITSARDLVWTGSASGNWNTTDKNWVESGSSTAVAFANGDAVTFDDSATRANCRVAASVRPASVTFRNNSDFLLWASDGSRIAADSGPTDKYGTGTLFLSNNLSVSTSDVHIWKGTVKNLVSNQAYSFGGYRKIYVHAGGKLWFYERNCGGSVTGGYADVIVYTNGVFDFSKGTAGVVPVRSLTLDGGSLSYGAGGDKTYGSLKVECGFSVRGTEPYVIGPSGDYSNYVTIGYTSDTVFDVADITGDSAADLTLGLPLMKVSPNANSGWRDPYGCHEIVKTGAGTMVIDAGLVSPTSTNNAPGGIYRVQEGELVFAKQTSLSWGYAKPVIVNTNATLRFTSRNVMTSDLMQRPLREIRVDHGTFSFEDATGDYEGRGHHPFGALTLDHATFIYTNAIAWGGSGSLGMMTLGGKLTVVADKPLELLSSQMRDPSRCGVHLWSEPQEIWVGRTSADAAYDLCIDLPLFDRATSFNNSTTKVTSQPSGFIKTGPGTLELRHMANEFSGYTEIREGTVRLDRPDYSAKTFGSSSKTYLGNMMKEGRQVVVSTNGTLHIAQRNIFSSMEVTGMPSLKSELVIRGGTLVCSNATAVVGSGIGNLTFDDANFIYHKGNNAWGFWQINDTFRLTGTKPYDLRLSSDSALHSSQCFCLVPGTKTTIEVDDITQDGAVDVSLELGLTLPASDGRTNYVYGFTKSGSGTLRMAQRYNANSYLINGTNLVHQGTLQVDSVYGLSRSKLTLVEDGATLCGTGKVTNVEIKTGGGFAATKGRTEPLQVTGNLVLPEAGRVDFYSPGEEAPRQFRVPVATVAGTITAPNDFSGWTMKLNGGDAPPGFMLLRQGQSLIACRSQGTMLIFR
ncbi:MAG: autotransporter-associated beta strand repeat-containing protein [bacterium]|nr:autotransporter-associated beta strand repeat-containing protein [bacterium]